MTNPYAHPPASELDAADGSAELVDVSELPDEDESD